jgi:hypothetical protein
MSFYEADPLELRWGGNYFVSQNYGKINLWPPAVAECAMAYVPTRRRPSSKSRFTVTQPSIYSCVVYSVVCGKILFFFSLSVSFLR